MSRRAARIVAAGGAIAIALLAFRMLGRGPPERHAPVRPGLALPTPSAGEKAEFFFDLMRGGAQTELGNRTLPLWRTVGERALVALGEPALDFLLAPSRMDLYGKSPGVLSGVLRILPDMPGAGSHPGVYPFLLHWLDPAHGPRPAPGADWIADFRLLVFVAMQRFPREEAAAPCMEELERKERVYDLRKAALDILLRAHRGDAIAGIYDRLPPCPGEPEGDHRTHLMVLLNGLAAPGRSAEDRAQAAALEPVIRRGARSIDAGERINALAALLRLGHDEAASELRTIFRNGEAEGDEIVGWSALELLARDGPDAFVRDACVRKLTGPHAFTQGAGRGTALRLLARWWLEDPEILALLWRHLEGESRVEPLLLLPSLARADRAGTVRFLEQELASGDLVKRIPEALRFIAGHPIPEAGPAVFDLARRAAPETRPVFYAVLASLKTAGTEPLLLGELKGAPHPAVREAAVVELLNLGGEAGLEWLDGALGRGDRVVLDALLQRAVAAGPDGVPPALLPGILGRLRNAPGEEERRLALFILRFGGTLAGVGSGLQEAYRTEPSRQLASEIRTVLLEMAHR